MTTKPESELDKLLEGAYLIGKNDGILGTNDHDNLMPNIKKLAQQEVIRARKETEKAFGGCTNCYGKGYATVNDRWSGYGTDGDIGGLEGHVSGGNPNAMKFCKCDRGKQISVRIAQLNQQIEGSE